MENPSSQTDDDLIVGSEVYFPPQLRYVLPPNPPEDFTEPGFEASARHYARNMLIAAGAWRYLPSAPAWAAV